MGYWADDGPRWLLPQDEAVASLRFSLDSFHGINGVLNLHPVIHKVRWIALTISNLCCPHRQLDSWNCTTLANELAEAVIVEIVSCHAGQS